MKGLELLPIPEDQKKQITTLLATYKSEQIYFSIKEITNEEVIIKVFQKEKQDDKYLTPKELIDLTKNLLSNILAPLQVHVHPIPFVNGKIEDYTSEKVIAELDKLGLSIKNLVKLLNIDKTTLSRLLSPNNELSQSEKAMFYYLFKYLRSQDNRN